LGSSKSLKESIKNNGQWIANTVNQERVILDGRHRFQVCQELKLEPKIQIKSPLSEIDQKISVIDSNLKRRQFNDFQKAELDYCLERIYREGARARQLSR